MLDDDDMEALVTLREETAPGREISVPADFATLLR